MQLKTFFKTYKLLILLIIIDCLFRFWDYGLPALLQSDSPKYFAPLQVIQLKMVNWIWEPGLSYSPFYRFCSYWLQLANNGSIDMWIPVQKLLGIYESVLVYLICLRFTRSNHLIAFIVALFYGINPWRLFMENVIFAEGVYIPLIVSALFVFILFADRLRLNKKLDWLLCVYSIIFGILISLIPLTKEVTIWKYFVLTGIFIFSIKDWILEKSKVLIICFAIISLSSFMVDLPLMLYNQSRFNRFSIVAVPAMGGHIWGLNEKMVRNSKSEKQWISKYILDTVNEYKRQKGYSEDVEDFDSYIQAVVKITVAGREGRFVNPVTGQLMSPEEFSDTFSDYYFETSFGDPQETIKRVAKSFVKNFSQPVQTFKLLRRSWWRTNSEYELFDTYLMVPASLSDLVSPKVASLPVVSTRYLSPDGWFKDAHHIDKYDENVIPLHVDQRTDVALLYSKPCLNIKWINLWANFNWSIIVALIFVISVIAFFAFGGFLAFDLVQYFILGHSLFYGIVPAAISQGDPRYALHSTAAMLVFSVSVWYRLLVEKNKTSL